MDDPIEVLRKVKEGARVWGGYGDMQTDAIFKLADEIKALRKHVDGDLPCGEWSEEIEARMRKAEAHLVDLCKAHDHVLPNDQKAKDDPFAPGKWFLDPHGRVRQAIRYETGSDAIVFYMAHFMDDCKSPQGYQKHQCIPLDGTPDKCKLEPKDAVIDNQDVEYIVRAVWSDGSLWAHESNLPKLSAIFDRDQIRLVCRPPKEKP